MNIYLPETISPDQVVATLGIISDTHMPQRWLEIPTAVSTIFKNIDLLLHAGDVGELWVLDKLSHIAPVIAVHGNDETKEATDNLPEQQIITIAGQRILLWHGHYRDRIDEMTARKNGDFRVSLNRIAQRGQRSTTSLVIFGHWHIPLVYEHEGVTIINPGAIASGGMTVRQSVQSVALLFLLGNGRFHLTHVDLGNPTQPYFPKIFPDAGWEANGARFIDTILSDELKSVQSQLFQQLYPLAPKQLSNIRHAIAHECWANQRDLITTDALRTGIQNEPTLNEEKKRKLIELLDSIVAG
ncbi:MAG: metallophosphoesterase family protein [Chloroflexi bacterium]|nr:metallophosphoesterase family protein [Chloroflexota bacterium]